VGREAKEKSAVALQRVCFECGSDEQFEEDIGDGNWYCQVCSDKWEAAAAAAAEVDERGDEDERVPDELLCPITFALFRDLVSTVDGHTYERATIEQWLEHHESWGSTSP
jgi:hypothetical protein